MPRGQRGRGDHQNVAEVAGDVVTAVALLRPAQQRLGVTTTAVSTVTSGAPDAAVLLGDMVTIASDRAISRRHAPRCSSALAA
jgi:hypothetical protein